MSDESTYQVISWYRDCPPRLVFQGATSSLKYARKFIQTNMIHWVISSGHMQEYADVKPTPTACGIPIYNNPFDSRYFSAVVPSNDYKSSISVRLCHYVYCNHDVEHYEFVEIKRVMHRDLVGQAEVDYKTATVQDILDDNGVSSLSIDEDIPKDAIWSKMFWGKNSEKAVRLMNCILESGLASGKAAEDNYLTWHKRIERTSTLVCSIVPIIRADTMFRNYIKED